MIRWVWDTEYSRDKIEVTVSKDGYNMKQLQTQPNCPSATDHNMAYVARQILK